MRRRLFVNRNPGWQGEGWPEGLLADRGGHGRREAKLGVMPRHQVAGGRNPEDCDTETRATRDLGAQPNLPRVPKWVWPGPPVT